MRLRMTAAHDYNENKSFALERGGGLCDEMANKIAAMFYLSCEFWFRTILR